MWWITDVIVPAVLILGVCCFVRLVRFQTQRLTSKTTVTAESLYPRYADSARNRKQRKYAREHEARPPRRQSSAGVRQ